MNIWGKIGILTVALLGGSKLMAATRAKKVSDEMNIKLINPRIHKISTNPLTGGVEIRTDVLLQNPTNTSLQLTQPYVQIISNGKVIASSAVNKKLLQLSPMSDMQLDTISITLDWNTLISKIASLNYNFPQNLNFIQKIGYLIKNYQTIISQLELAIRYTTYANGLFYSQTQKIGS